ncbi:MAG: hypothetical protein CMM37_05175 [Rhodospirillaceae bacterium]|jgi:pimeloyl-ACP methyl ester carboxylesterase|nr:hypothetical protein [Rhodospirillaceae bacterium]
MAFKIPKPREIFELTMGDGAVVRVRMHGNANGPRIFLGNGNGFAADGYFPFWRLFAEDFELAIFDFRNHGQNPTAVSGLPGHNYAQMTLDLENIFQSVNESLGKKTNIGIFHSMSGRTAMKHACELGFKWDALVLFDPPNVPPKGHREYKRMDIFEDRLYEWAMGRVQHFSDPEELARHYKETRAHASWVDGAHELMARCVLQIDEQNGGWKLSCPREFEASIYIQAMTLNLWPNASDIGGPVKLFGCDPEAKGAPGPAFANKALAEDGGFDYQTILGTGHLMQIQEPEQCHEGVIEFLKKTGIL